MQKWQRHLAVAALAVALAAALAAAGLHAAAPAAAAVPSGAATYLVNGEEVLFSLDPIQRQGGLLLPAEVLGRLGVQVSGPDSRRTVRLSRSGLQVTATLGSTAAATAAGPITLGTAPARQGGYLYVPLELADDLGFAHRSEGAALVELRDLLAPGAQPAEIGSDSYDRLLRELTRTASLRLDRVSASARLTRMTPDLAASMYWSRDGALRSRALDLLGQYTVIQVWLDIGAGSQAAQFNPANLYLVDDQGRQYATTGQVVDISGSLTGALVPEAENVGLVLFPRLQPAAASVRIFHNGDGFVAGPFPL